MLYQKVHWLLQVGLAVFKACGSRELPTKPAP